MKPATPVTSVVMDASNREMQTCQSGKKIAAKRPPFFHYRENQGLCGRSPLLLVAARMPRMIATSAISGMMKPPRSSLAFPVVAPLRAATESGAADVVWARTGVLAMETASAAATDAFLKLILNSLLSCSALAVPQWYIVDNPKIAALCRASRTVALLHNLCF